MKRQIPCEYRRELFRCKIAFENEIAAYQQIIPLFRDIVTHITNPYPECMFAGQDEHGDAVMLEDLRESNFKMVNRLVGLDLEHSKIVMKVSSNDQIFLFYDSTRYICFFCDLYRKSDHCMDCL